MQKVDFHGALEQVLAKDSRYDGEAYLFVRAGLDFTTRKLRNPAPGELCHVSGSELLEGIRQFGIDQFGPMARVVLNSWGVHRCEDFGEIVFNLVDAGVLGRTPEDKKEDFAGGYDFRDAFDLPFVPPSQQAETQRRWRDAGAPLPRQPTERG